MYINKVQLYGNITKAIELKTTQGGNSVTSFSLATNRTYKDKDGNKKEEVQFHNLVAWGKTAELINQYCGKGSPLYVEGRLQTRNYEAKDGSKRYVTEVVIESMQFGPKSQKSTQGDDISTSGDEETPKIDEKDLPF